MWRACGTHITRTEMNTGFWQERNHAEDTDGDDTKMDLKKTGLQGIDWIHVG